MALSDVQIRSLKPADKLYKVTDEKGLYLEVSPNGSKLWRYKYLYMGKNKRIALGRYPEVGLAEARRRRLEARGKRGGQVGIAVAAHFAFMRAQHGQTGGERPPLQPVAVEHAIEPLDQIDVAFENPFEVERGHVEAASCSKAHGGKLDPAFGKTVIARLELGNPRLAVDLGRCLRTRTTERRSGGQQAAQVFVELVNMLRALGGLCQLLQGTARLPRGRSRRNRPDCDAPRRACRAENDAPCGFARTQGRGRPAQGDRCLFRPQGDPPCDAGCAAR